MIHCVSWLLCGLTAASCNEPPQALLRIEQARQAWRTGQIEWTWSTWLRPGVPWNYTSKWAEDDIVVILRGDDEGVISRGADGRPHTSGYGPQYSLFHDNKCWQVTSVRIQAEVKADVPRSGQLIDLKSLGLGTSLPMSGVHETLWEPTRGAPAPRRYSQKVDGRHEVIRGEGENDVVTWWIDREAGGLPTRVLREINGEVVAESQITLRNYDGTWFPETVLLFGKDYKGGKQPKDIIRIHSIELNAPNQPTALTPAHIGIDAGVTVLVYDGQARFQWGGTWDGSQIVPREEFDRRVAAGELQYGPNFLRNTQQIREGKVPGAFSTSVSDGSSSPDSGHANAGGDDGSQAGAVGSIARRESEWERYTRRFIERYRLDDSQRQKALLLLKACEDSAQDYIKAHKTELDEYERRIAELKTDRERAEAAQRDHELLAPLTRILEERLKPGLEKLPTRAQRRAVEYADKRSHRVDTPVEKAGASKPR